MSEIAVGQVLLERYTIERRLGAGSNGTVWLARDRLSHEAVAIKSLHAHLSEEPAPVDRFTREAEVLLRLAHPHIAGARRFHQDGERVWFVLELAPGRTLDVVIGDRTSRGLSFTDAEIMRLFDQLADAIAHAHAQGVVHRDLKPLNVMVDEDHELSVKLLDFGLAKLVDEDGRDATTRGRRLGSMFYMAPEQVHGEAIDARTDVFALGAMLFELLTLRRAWAVGSGGDLASAFDTPLRARQLNMPAEVFQRIVTGPRPRVSSYRPSAPRPLDGVVMRAMAIDPAARYLDVPAFHRAFCEAMAIDTAEATARDGDVGPTRGVSSFADPPELDPTPVLSPPLASSQPVVRLGPSESRWRLVALAASVAAVGLAALTFWVVRSGASAAEAMRERTAPETDEPVMAGGMTTRGSSRGRALVPEVRVSGAEPDPSAEVAEPKASTGASAKRAPRRARETDRVVEPDRPYARLWALLADAKSRGDPSIISRLGEAIVGAAAADVDDDAARTKIQRLAESSSLVGDLQGLELSLSLLSSVATGRR